MAVRVNNPLNRNDCYVEVENPGLTITSGYTISFWYRPLAYKQAADYHSMAIVSYGEDKTSAPTNRVGFLVRLEYYGLAPGLRQAAYTGAGAGVATEWREETWKHVICGAGGDMDGKFFLNGEFVSFQAMGVTPNNPTTESFKIGRTHINDNSGSTGFCGDLAEVAFWTRSLSYSEIQEVYIGGPLAASNGAGPALYLPLREGSLGELQGSAAPLTVNLVNVAPSPHPFEVSPVERFSSMLDSFGSPVKLPRSFAPLGTRLGTRGPLKMSAGVY